MLIHAADPDLDDAWDDEAQAAFSTGLRRAIGPG